MNVERLLAVRQAILDHPEQVEMSWWFCDDRRLAKEVGTVPDLTTACGTMGCIAGWALALFAPGESLRPWGAGERAREVLAVAGPEGRDLFHRICWPVSLAEEYDRAHTGPERAKVVADRIDAFLVEHGVVIPEPPRLPRETAVTEVAV